MLLNNVAFEGFHGEDRCTQGYAVYTLHILS